MTASAHAAIAIRKTSARSAAVEWIKVFACNAIARGSAIALGPHGIRVNAVAPGFIDAGMSAPIYEDADVRAVRATSVPLGSLGTAEDVAEAVAFLASDKSRYTTGHQLMVDGGVSFSLKNHLPRKAPRQRT